MRQSRPKHVDPLNSAWSALWRTGHLIEPPTPCSGHCSDYGLRDHRGVFFELYPIGPWCCEVCGAERRKNEIHIDHLDFIHGGLGDHNCPENLRPLCGKCNRSRRRINSPRRHELWGKENRSRAASGKPKSPEHREALAAASKRQWESLTPDERAWLGAKYRSGQLIRWSKMSPNARLKATEAAREAARSPEAQAKKGISEAAAWSAYTAEERATRIEHQREGFAAAGYNTEKRRAAGKHGRLHVDRGIVDPDCEFCLRGTRKRVE